MYSTVNLYSNDIVVDVITRYGNRNFHLRFFVKVRVVTIQQLRCQQVEAEELRLDPHAATKHYTS